MAHTILYLLALAMNVGALAVAAPHIGAARLFIWANTAILVLLLVLQWIR